MKLLHKLLALCKQLVAIEMVIQLSGWVLLIVWVAAFGLCALLIEFVWQSVVGTELSSTIGFGSSAVVATVVTYPVWKRLPKVKDMSD
ncbi:MAG: hypothetical protein R6V31_04365 [Halohasta sp.]